MRGFTIDFDSVGGPIACTEDDTILRVALRAGLGFPYECNSGGCGSCKFKLVDGAVDTLREEAPGISSRDRARAAAIWPVSAHP